MRALPVGCDYHCALTTLTKRKIYQKNTKFFFKYNFFLVYGISKIRVITLTKDIDSFNLTRKINVTKIIAFKKNYVISINNLIIYLYLVKNYLNTTVAVIDKAFLLLVFIFCYKVIMKVLFVLKNVPIFLNEFVKNLTFMKI